MENNIGVDPGDLLGLQSELAKRLRIAHEKGDADFPKALAAILVASPGRRKLFVDEHPFKREGSILLREACSPTKGEQKIIDKDPRAMRVLHIDWDSIPYRSFVERDEKITGHEKLARMKREGVIRLDFSWAKVLLIDNEHYGTDSILEHLHREMAYVISTSLGPYSNGRTTDLNPDTDNTSASSFANTVVGGRVLIAA